MGMMYVKRCSRQRCEHWRSPCPILSGGAACYAFKRRCCDFQNTNPSPVQEAVAGSGVNQPSDKTRWDRPGRAVTSTGDSQRSRFPEFWNANRFRNSWLFRVSLASSWSMATDWKCFRMTPRMMSTGVFLDLLWKNPTLWSPESG